MPEPAERSRFSGSVRLWRHRCRSQGRRGASAFFFFGGRGMKSLVTAVFFLVFMAGTALAASPKEVEQALARAQQAHQANQPDQAAQEFLVAAQALAELKQPDKARLAYGNAAVLFIQAENWTGAIQAYTALRALPGKIPANELLKMTRNLVTAAEQTGDNNLKAEAIAGLMAAKPKLDPDDRLNFLALQGDAYRALECYALAVQSYEQALAIKNVPPERRLTLLTALGLCQGNLGRYEPALKNLEQARKEAERLQASQSLVEATSNIGILYWESGRYAQAAETLERALDISRQAGLRRHEGVDLNNLGLVRKSAGRRNDAIIHISDALAIAREVGHQRDEAIALGNLALLRRLAGYNQAALADYQAALRLCQQIGFREGQASCLMGLARLDMLDKNYPAALGKLHQAAQIYQDIENPGFLAEAMAQIGLVHQKSATPERRSRDLVYDDSDITPIALSPEENLAKSAEYFQKALDLAETSGRPEIIWSALHGLAFAAARRGDLPEAERLYARAIDVAMSIRGQAAEMLPEFLHDKDDLFAEAADVCARLYQDNKDPDLLRKQMAYDEICRNEIMRANLQAAAITYDDPDKQALHDDLNRLEAARKKSQNAALASKDGPSASLKAEHVLNAKEASTVAREFESKLALWKKKYPQDAVMFDSMASVDTASLRQALKSEQAIVQYIPLEDSLIIMVVTKESVDMFRVQVAYQDLASLIRDRFIAGNIEPFGHQKMPEKEGLEQALDIMAELNSYLYEPIRERLADKNRLYILTSKYLSYVPFSALVTGRDQDGRPRFLVEDKTISLVRLSFVNQTLKAGPAGRGNTDMIAVGNPQHQVLGLVLPPLDGAEKEAVSAVAAVTDHNPKASTLLLTRDQATKTAWVEAAQTRPYGIMYFATHGVPYAEVKHDFGRIRRAYQRDPQKYASYDPAIRFYEQNFQNDSHLNGFLYMAYPDKSDGLLRLKDILELPADVFGQADLAVLSACNTAVSYSPKVIKDKNMAESLEDQDTAQALIAAGWSPGVDQVCLVDTFMKRNFRSVYGTLWFTDDLVSAMIMTSFMNNLGKMPPAEALRAAQLSYLADPPQGYTDAPLHPYFWACGNIFGQ